MANRRHFRTVGRSDGRKGGLKKRFWTGGVVVDGLRRGARCHVWMSFGYWSWAAQVRKKAKERGDDYLWL